MANQIIPTAECEEAAWALNSFLKGRTSPGPSDDYYRRDWAPLWAELSKDGWTTIADRSSPSEAEFSLLDLTAIAEAWGRHLVPQPFVATLLARRWLRERPDPTTRLSHMLAERGSALDRPLPRHRPGCHRRGSDGQGPVCPESRSRRLG